MTRLSQLCRSGNEHDLGTPAVDSEEETPAVDSEKEAPAVDSEKGETPAVDGEEEEALADDDGVLSAPSDVTLLSPINEDGGAGLCVSYKKVI